MLPIPEPQHVFRSLVFERNARPDAGMYEEIVLPVPFLSVEQFQRRKKLKMLVRNIMQGLILRLRRDSAVAVESSGVVPSIRRDIDHRRNLYGAGIVRQGRLRQDAP